MTYDIRCSTYLLLVGVFFFVVAAAAVVVECSDVHSLSLSLNAWSKKLREGCSPMVN